jgi:Domain of unknown function (DUF4177)
MEWEYSVLVLDPTNSPDLAASEHSVLMEVLNAKGRQGWELVSVAPDAKGLDYFAYYFKRPVST